MNHVRKAHPTLTSDHGRNTSKNHVRKAHPTLTYDHGRNTSKTHVRKGLHLHLTMWEHTASEWLCTYIWPCENKLHQNGFALISGHVRTHRIRMALHLYLTMWEHTTSEWICTYIWPCENTPHQNGSALIFDLILSERICTYIWPHLVRKALHWSCGNTSHNHIRIYLHLYLIMWEHIPQSHPNGPELIMW